MVNEVPKFQSNSNKIEAHCIRSKDSDLCTHLDLSGIFSFFPVLKPSMNELHDCDKVFMTPDSSKWSPYSTEYSTKEMAMIDFNGNLIIDDALEKIKKGQKIYPVDDSTYIISTCNVDDYNKGMDLVLDSSYIQSNDSNISGFDFSDVISQRCEISKVAISIGAVSAESGNNLFSPYFS